MDALRRSLSNPAPVYVCLGDQGVLLSEATALVRGALVSGPMSAFYHGIFVAGEEGALGFVDAARQVPVMAPRRLVEVRQVQDANVALLDALLAYVAAPVEGTVLLVSGQRMPAAVGGVDRGVRIVNAAKKSGYVEKFDGEGVDLLSFARARAEPWGVRVSAAAGQKLRELGGDDLDTLAGNVERCAGFVGEGGEITPEVVESVCASTAEADVWKLTDAIVARDADTALAEMHRLLEDGEPSHRLQASVAWQLRQVLLVQDAARRKISDKEAGIRVPAFKLRAVRAAVEARPVSPSAWLEELAVASRRMNSSRAGDRRVFEAFVMRLAGR